MRETRKCRWNCMCPLWRLVICTKWGLCHRGHPHSYPSLYVVRDFAPGWNLKAQKWALEHSRAVPRLWTVTQRGHRRWRQTLGPEFDPSEAWKSGRSLRLGQWIEAPFLKHSNWVQLWRSLSARVLSIILKFDIFTFIVMLKINNINKIILVSLFWVIGVTIFWLTPILMLK